MAETINYTDYVLDHIYDIKFEDLEPEAIRRAKTRLIDAMGVLSIGATIPDTRATVEMVAASGGKEEASVATFGIKLPMEAAAFLNAIIMRSYDFEAIDAESIEVAGPTTAAHISGTTIPTALVTAEAMHASGKDLLRALILGDDLTARALNAGCFSVHDKFDGNGTANLLGSTLIASLLLGLSKEEAKGALAVAVNEMSGSMQTVFEKTVIFKFPISASAKNGIFAAKLAKSGYIDCLSDPINGPRGFFELYYSNPSPEIMLKDYGKHFIADCVIKPWPACRATHASIDSVLNALSGQSFEPEQVESIDVHITQGSKNFVGQGFKFGMNKNFQGAFSIDFLVATAVLRGDVRAEFFTPEMMTEDRLGKMLEKVNLIPDQPAGTSSFKVDSEIKLVDGTTLEHHTTYPLGDYYRSRMTDEQFFGKYYANIEFGKRVSKKNADAMVTMINNLENLDDVAKLMDLIR